MSIRSLFSQLLGKPEEVNLQLENRKDSFFLDEQRHNSFLKNGWCLIEQVVNQEEIGSFLQTYEEISHMEGFHIDKHLLNSGRLFNPHIRQKVQNVINKNAKTILPRLFNMDKVDSNTGGAYQVKPPSDQSDLQIHQDSTVIDEQKDYCLFVWIPFCDVTETNGPIWVLPGSHLWGNTQRSLGVPWNFLKHIDVLRKYMFPVTLKAGDVLVFDPALVHSSTPNFSTETRCAITITVLRKNYQLVYYFKGKNDPPDTIEKYEVDEKFYLGYDFESRPDETKHKKTVEEYKSFDLTERQLVKLIEKHLPD